MFIVHPGTMISLNSKEINPNFLGFL
jgi:hypothetical protein